MGLLDYVPGLGSGDEGGEGEIRDLTKAQLYDDVDADIGYSAKRAIRVAEDASIYANYDEQGSVTLRTGPLTMQSSSRRALKQTFGDMLFGDDRENRTTPKMIQSEDGINYEEIGAATIGAGLAAAKVDEVGRTDYTPAYGEFFADVVKGHWNMNPDAVSDTDESIDENPELYERIVRETAKSVEGQLLEPRPHPEADLIEEELEREREEEGEKPVAEEELN